MDNKRVISCSQASDASEFRVMRRHDIKPDASGSILWHIVNFTPDMPKHLVILRFTQAFDQWQAKLDTVPPVGRLISFKSTDRYDLAHIKIMFLDPLKKDHVIKREDGETLHFKHRWPFDANGGILAHVPFDITDIYLDEGENWGDLFKWEGDTLFAPLLETVLHEIGHCLDLDHTKDPADIMYPTTDGKTRDITQDSISGLIEAGWGKKKEPYLALLGPSADTVPPAPKVVHMVGKLPTGAKPYGTRPIKGITQIVVHHSADNGTVESIAKYHTAPEPTGHGWPGIGYTFAIDKAGTVYKLHELDTLCFNVAKQNTKSLGICLIGDYEKDTPPEVQVKALKWLVGILRNVLPEKVTIMGHLDTGVATSCPGKNLYSLIPSL